MTTKARRSNSKEIIEELGGAKRMHDQLQDYMNLVSLVDSKRKELMKQYPDKWVAMYQNDIVTVGDTRA
jgi:hypothetical protein